MAVATADQLTELFKTAYSAAQKAEEAAEEDRCIDALRAMKSLRVTTSILLSTQVGRQLRKLTRHSRSSIKSIALDILEDWKKLVSSEATSKSEAESPKSSANGSVICEEKGKAATRSNGNSTPKLRALPKSNDASRDKMREILLEAFKKVPQEAGAQDLASANARDPVAAAVEVESALFAKLASSKGDKKAKYRSIAFNLKDPNNPDLRRRLLLGKISGAQLTTMSAEEMASDQRKAENKQIKDKALFECERGMKQEATTDQFKCGKCGHRECTYFQKQTRSADEPMTTYVTCVNCNNRWKFC